jgi:outer membrane protein W
MQRSVVLAALLVFLMPAVAFAAPDREGKWDMGFNLSGAMPDDDELEGAVYAGGQVSYGITPWIALGGEIGGTSFDQDDDSQSLGFTDLGELTAVPVMVNTIFRANLENQAFVPYGVVGLGVIFWNFDESDQLDAAAVEANVDASFGAKLGGGVDWFVNDNWIANFEGSYYFNDADVKLELNGVRVGAVDDVDTSFWLIGGGAKYVFN